MPYVPPWLNVSPKDFVEAASQGGALGARLGALSTEAGMNRERIASSERENAARVGAAQAEAAARLTAEAKAHELGRQLQQWELTQRLASEEKRAQEALAERQWYGQGVLQNRDDANRIRQEMNDIRLNALEGRGASKLERIATDKPIFERDPVSGEWIQKTKGAKAAADELPSVLNDSAVKSSGFSLLHPSTWFNRTAPAPTPEVAPLAVPPPAAVPVSPYRVGGNYGGLIFKGGDPNSQDNWEPVGDVPAR